MFAWAFWPPLHICCFFLEAATPIRVAHSVPPRRANVAGRVWPPAAPTSGKAAGLCSAGSNAACFAGPEAALRQEQGSEKTFCLSQLLFGCLEKGKVLFPLS